jgi:hypothetical protein
MLLYLQWPAQSQCTREHDDLITSVANIHVKSHKYLLADEGRLLAETSTLNMGWYTGLGFPFT